ncbi:MAG: BON domain-containing protein [Thermoleophilia bacterium]|nr:BON domain-containing protein [Thermoleophilia bacterium]
MHVNIAKSQEDSRSRVALPLAAAVGAIVAFFFDPANGRGRRAKLAQRVPAFLRRRKRAVEQAARGVTATAYGVKQQVAHRQEEHKDLNDPALAAKVETIIFRDPDVPKGQINVNVQDGIVQLRGEVPSPEMVDELVEQARSVEGVRDVENLLHLPGTPAPMHE